MRGAYVDTRSGRLHYRETGAGPAVVLLHGGSMDSTYWLRLAPILAGGHRVLALDMPPLGLSEAPAAEPVDLGWYGDVVLDFINALEVAHVTLVGFHVGASIAVATAARRPERVANLVLVGLFAAETQHEGDAFAASTGFDFDDARVADPVGIIRDFEASGARTDDPGLFTAHLTGRLLAGRRLWWQYRAIFRFDIAAAMRATAVPTLIMHLDQDVTPREMARKALDHLSDAEWLDVKGDPSTVVGDPAVIAGPILEFVARRRGSTTARGRS